MHLKYYLGCLYLGLGCFFFANAQDCTLGIGGKDKDIVVQIFQLNDEQQGKLEVLRGELSVKNKILEDRLKKLLEEHPQSNEEDLTRLAKKYKEMELEIVELAVSYDKKLIQLFNDRQYERYVELCTEAMRKPLYVDRVPSVPTPEKK